MVAAPVSITLLALFLNVTVPALLITNALVVVIVGVPPNSSSVIELWTRKRSIMPTSLKPVASSIATPNS